jgi:hypothetical protein
MVVSSISLKTKTSPLRSSGTLDWNQLLIGTFNMAYDIPTMNSITEDPGMVYF